MKRLLAARIALLLTTALGTSAAAAGQTNATALPPYSPAYEPRTADERGLWMEADEDERVIRDSPLTIHDEALNAYVKHVLCTTVGQDRCAGVRIYIQEIAAPNAFMTANGTMVIWSGLFLRIRNEAELGAILGHEFAHFELRHGLTKFKHARSMTDVLAWLSVLGGMTRTDTGLNQLLLIGSYYKFTREQEKEADLLSLRYLGASSYPTIAASQFFQHMMGEADATAAGRKQKSRQKYTAGFFDGHPTDLNRAIYLADAASKMKGGGNSESAGYRMGIAKLLPLVLNDQIKQNDFGGTEYLLNQLASEGGWTGELLFARAELYRARGNPRDLVTASQFYADAIKLGYTAPEARRGLGLSLMRSGQLTEAKAALTEYLRLKPEASDAKAINALLSN